MGDKSMIEAHLKRYPHVKKQMTGGLLVKALEIIESQERDAAGKQVTISERFIVAPHRDRYYYEPSSARGMWVVRDRHCPSVDFAVSVSCEFAELICNALNRPTDTIAISRECADNLRICAEWCIEREENVVGKALLEGSCAELTAALEVKP